MNLELLCKEGKCCLDCKHCFIEDLYDEACCGHPKHKDFCIPKKEICDDFEDIDYGH